MSNRQTDKQTHTHTHTNKQTSIHPQQSAASGIKTPINSAEVGEREGEEATTDE